MHHVCNKLEFFSSRIIGSLSNYYPEGTLNLQLIYPFIAFRQRKKIIEHNIPWGSGKIAPIKHRLTRKLANLGNFARGNRFPIRGWTLKLAKISWQQHVDSTQGDVSESGVASRGLIKRIIKLMKWLENYTVNGRHLN